jgi:hypothetical protein
MIRLTGHTPLIASIAVSTMMISHPVQAASGEMSFDTTRAYCDAVCSDYPPGKCGARFTPSPANPDYGLCQMAVIEGGSLAQPPQAGSAQPSPQATTEPPPQAATDNGGYDGGSPQGGQGFMQYMKPVTDPDKARELQQGLGVAPHTPSSGDNTLLGN